MQWLDKTEPQTDADRDEQTETDAMVRATADAVDAGALAPTHARAMTDSVREWMGCELRESSDEEEEEGSGSDTDLESEDDVEAEEEEEEEEEEAPARRPVARADAETSLLALRIQAGASRSGRTRRPARRLLAD